MDRRTFLRRSLVATAGAGMLTTADMVTARAAEPGSGPYGSIDGIDPDANGLILPEGFTSRVVAVSGDPVAGTDHLWHLFPDGAATFPDGDAGWYYACNSEVFNFMTGFENHGGASSVHFDADGQILDAFPILSGSHSNCSGGPTPWGTWLSCEEGFFPPTWGRVWECDPTGEGEAIARDAMGFFAHEAVAVDPEEGMLYLTEDSKGGVLYRFTPDAYPDLSGGRLEAMIVIEDSVTWGEVADPTGASVPTQEQVPGAYVTPGAEGIWYHDGWIWFTTKTDNRVHAVDLRNQQYELVWDGSGDRQPLTGVDNITVEEGSGDLFVAEDGGNMELVVISPEGEVAPFCRIADPAHEGSEVTGPCFNPTRDRLYFSSQRGPTTRPTNEMVAAVDLGNFGGVTYEVKGPFRGRIKPPAPSTTTVAPTTTTTTVAPTTTTTTVAPTTTTTTTIPSPTTTLARAAEVAVASPETDEGGGGAGLAVGLSAAVLAAFGVGLLALRRRTGGSDGPAGEPTEDDDTG